jgi:serine/threonine protein kinase
MSPEQALGESEDARSDIFSLGLVFYEMLTGEAPFHEADAPTTVLSVLRKTPPPPSTRNHAVPRYFDAVVARMISKSLHGRYDTAAAAAAALRRLAERQVPSDAAAGPTRSRRRPWIVAALLLVVAAAIAAWQWAGT